MYIILFIGIALISYLVQANLNSKFKKYSQVGLASGMTGREVAEKMLHDNGIYNVRVTCVPGHLTDHYNPADGTVNLSESVYHSNSVAAAAVAAHECGHAVQHGFLISKARLYKLTAKGDVPFRKYGNKLLFSRRELLSWAESLARRVNDKGEAALAIARSANRKLRSHGK